MIGDFRLIVVNPSPKLTDREKFSIATSFGYSSQDQGIENNTKRILPNILKRWNKNNSSAHPSKYTLTYAELVALKVYSVEVK